MRGRSLIAWRIPVLALVLVGIVGGVAGAKPEALPGSKPVRIEWILDDGGVGNMRVAVFRGDKEVYWFEVGRGPNDPIKPVYRVGDTAVAAVCAASSTLCGFITKEHQLYIIRPS